MDIDKRRRGLRLCALHDIFPPAQRTRNVIQLKNSSKLFFCWHYLKLRVQAHDLQNQGAAKNLKGSSSLKRKVEADSHNVALEGTLREVSKGRETKRPNTAVDGGIDSADALETGMSSICKYGSGYNTFDFFRNPPYPTRDRS